MMTAGLTKGTSGNISIFDRETGAVAISPSGIDYFLVEPEDVVITDLEGNILEGNRKPSSELGLHLALYRVKPEAGAVVHTHSDYCVILSCLNIPIEAVHYVIADAGTAKIPVAPYRTFGTKELADAAAAHIGKSKAVLLANHGMVACGNDLSAAFSLASTCEWLAMLQWKCLCVDRPRLVSENDLRVVMESFAKYGQPEGDGKGYQMGEIAGDMT